MKFLKVCAGLFAAWLVVLLVLGYVAGSKVAVRLADRIGEPLQATATIAGADLALIRGHVDLEKLAVRREDNGHLAIDVADIHCELPPLGWSLIDHDCRELAIRGMRVSVSAIGVFEIRNAKRPPVTARRVVIDDAVLEFSPSAIAPSLGRIAITVEHAEAKSTVFKTPLSWIFSLDKLQAKLELPGGVMVKLGYANGKLSVAGTLFGSNPVEFPVDIPVANLADDPRGELRKLVELGKTIAEQAVLQRGKDWVKSKLP
ncbi:MAG: hypothetical protein H0T79_12995 [Deltaproteobacteria bacterium]|nr:hypothetical protein [Deltaproteobacteria bacterium]